MQNSSEMSKISSKSSLAILGIASLFVGVFAMATPVAFAWNPCSLTLSPSSQSTTVPAGATVFTFLLTYSETPTYASYFTFSTSSTNGAWSVSGASPSRVPATGTSDSISQTISVTVTAPSTPSSTTSVTVTAINYYDHSANCHATLRLTTTGVFPPPPTVPEFPIGMVLLLALAVPALLVLKSRRLPLPV